MLHCAAIPYSWVGLEYGYWEERGEVLLLDHVQCKYVRLDVNKDECPIRVLCLEIINSSIDFVHGMCRTFTWARRGIGNVG